MPKIKRNKELAKRYSNMPCFICGSRNQVSGHHIISFASRPDLDVPENILPLCFTHHREIHDKGRDTFIKEQNIGHFLEMRGFEYDELGGWYLNV